jgi:LemA protein
MLWTILLIAAVIVLWLVLAYNRFVTLNVRVDEAWADIEVQMKRRYDLIPNLVNTVKGYATHESGVFERVTEARARALQAGSLAEHTKAENMLTGALKSVFALAENYPDLKANQNFLELQKELADTENKVQASRRFYNGNVRDLNTKLKVFPSNLAAKLFKFVAREFFDLEDTKGGTEAKEPVTVKF